jgi:hypothetical protein
MADEYCIVLSKYEDVNSTNHLEIADKLMDINIREEEYGNVGGEHFRNRFNTLCPIESKKLTKLYSIKK